jgi:hypothetical protein
MDISTPLVSVVIGGLIATIPILISNAVQIYLHISEKRQREKRCKDSI